MPRDCDETYTTVYLSIAPLYKIFVSKKNQGKKIQNDSYGCRLHRRLPLYHSPVIIYIHMYSGGWNIYTYIYLGGGTAAYTSVWLFIPLGERICHTEGRGWNREMKWGGDKQNGKKKKIQNNRHLD